MPAMHASDFKPNQAAEPNGPRRGGWRRYLLLSLAASIFIVCCGLAYGAGCFLAEWRNAQRTAAFRDDQDATQLGPLAAALPYAGQWAFDDLDWSVKSQMIAAKNLDAEFARLGDAAKTIHDSQLPETDPELVGLIAAFGMTPVQRGGDKVYRVEKPDLKAVLVAARSRARPGRSPLPRRTRRQKASGNCSPSRPARTRRQRAPTTCRISCHFRRVPHVAAAAMTTPGS